MTWMQKIERLCKWRSVFAAMQLGTRLDTDSEFKAVADHRELSILLRMEVTALTGLMIQKGIFTIEEFNEEIGKEADYLNAGYERRFPGATAHLDGIHYDLANPNLKEWLGKFPA